MAANRHKSYSAYLQCAPHTLTRRPHHPTGPLASGYGATRPPPTDNRAQPTAQPPCVKPGCPGKAAPRELTPRTAICTPARPPGHHTQRTLCRTLQGRRCTLPRGARIVPGAAGSPREPAGGTNIDRPRRARTCTGRKVNNYATTRRVTCGRQPIRAENRALGPRPANQRRANCTGVCCNPHRPVARVTVVSLRARAFMHRRPPCWQHATDTPAQHRPHNAPPCMVARPSRACMGVGRLRGCLGQADAVTLPRHGSHRNARTHTISRVKIFLAAAAFVREGARERVGHPLLPLRHVLCTPPAAGPDPRGPV